MSKNNQVVKVIGFALITPRLYQKFHLTTVGMPLNFATNFQGILTVYD